MNTSIRTHFNLARVSNLPTTWTNVLCAFILVGGFQWPAFIGAIVAVSLFYISGMYLNDWRDAAYDREHRPDRPIPTQAISRRAVLVFALVYFIAALVISLALNSQSLFWTLGLIVCITIYDLDHKNNSMSPWVMAACRALIYPWAATLAGQEFNEALWLGSVAAYTYTLGLTYIARGPVKAFSTKLTFAALVLAPAVMWLGLIGAHSLAIGLLSIAAFIVWSVYCLRGWFRTPPRIGFTVGNLIAGFCLLDLMVMSIAAPISVAIIVSVLLLFVITLKLQTFISGT